MYPPIFALAAADATVQSLIGTSPVRLWPFGAAPSEPTAPYALWQVVYGAPENYLNQRPDIDGFGVQVDAYAPTVTAARNVAKAIRDALEPSAYVTAYNGETRDEATGLYRYSFTVEFLTPR